MGLKHICSMILNLCVVAAVGNWWHFLHICAVSIWNVSTSDHVLVFSLHQLPKVITQALTNCCWVLGNTLDKSKTKLECTYLNCGGGFSSTPDAMELYHHDSVSWHRLGVLNPQASCDPPMCFLRPVYIFGNIVSCMMQNSYLI